MRFTKGKNAAVSHWFCGIFARSVIMRVTAVVVRMTLYLPRRLFNGQSGGARWLVAEGSHHEPGKEDLNGGWVAKGRSDACWLRCIDYPATG